MHRGIVFFLLTVFFSLPSMAPVAAQDRAWVQVEAQPTLGDAQARARDYAATYDNVNGFYLGSGWYAIALGPLDEPAAAALLSRLVASGAVPRDSFVADGSKYQSQFWPIGANDLAAAEPAAAAMPADPAFAAAEPVVEPALEPVVPDETQREARDSEAALTEAERKLLQVALQWAGFYDAAIDGAFGRGTRAAMAAWQSANALEPTGVLTTRQRAALIGAYNGVLEGMDLQLVRDAASGIEILIPAGVVAFDSYDPPFARFAPAGDLGVQVLLISQPGDQNRLFGLYEIMQTLEIVPTSGPRSRAEDSFELEGSDGKIHSFTYATLTDDGIKGFTLVWPAGDEERRSRVLAEMRASFTPLPGVLDPALAVPDEDQAIDLVAGLQVRRPQLSRSGFFIDAAGTVLTTIEAVADCDYLTIDETHTATLVHQDAALGLAVLRPDAALAPLGLAQFQSGVPRLQSDIAVGGFPYGSVLTRPSLTFGRLADLRGLNGEATLKRLEITAQPGDAGGPVFDNGGAVLGMLLPRSGPNGQVLPPDVGFAVDADAIIGSLGAAGITVSTTDSMAFVTPEALTRQATDMTVLVSCW